MGKYETAKAVYKCVCAFLNSAGFKYENDEERNAVTLTVTGEDFPVYLHIAANEGSQRLEVYSQLPFEIRPDKFVDLARACAHVNNQISAGKFSVLFDKNLLTYDDSHFFAGLSGFNGDYAKDIIATAFNAVEKYNDRFYAVNKGLMSANDFINKNQ